MQPQLHTPGGCIYSDNFLKLVHPPCLPYPSFHTVSIVAALLTPCVPSRKVKQINLSSNLYTQNSRLCQYRQCLLDEISSPGYPLISLLLCIYSGKNALRLASDQFVTAQYNQPCNQQYREDCGSKQTNLQIAVRYTGHAARQ